MNKKNNPESSKNEKNMYDSGKARGSVRDEKMNKEENKERNSEGRNSRQ